MIDGSIITLGIESSCDETAAAVLRGGRTVLSNIISSQIDVHKAFGGVVPEIASRHHLDNINRVVDQAMKEANVTWEEVDLIGVTYGPGLVGALLIGLSTAKAYALALGKPLVGVHHIEGHISANFIDEPDLKPPFIALIISGGHTSIVDVEGYGVMQVLGQTRDDAAGEAYDKVARILGLGYPGGPLIDKIAKGGNREAVEFKRVFLDKDTLDFSFSGIKTGVMNYINNEKQAGREISIPDVAASFQEAVLDVVVAKAVGAAVEGGKDKLVVAGGVAANTRLRERLREACGEKEIDLHIPSPLLCTDNAAMIASAAYYRYKGGRIDNLSLDAVAQAPLGREK